ncbi:hypothetical protein DB88DRAFT_544855 [Papiliotrema laurentii]|uniref:Uncharacterized protein n=1 Tax=Papiliotrema laurentii TaxID=5418 RepID=A0AAD9FUX4_PAPLA|nr:hypothetical protein DB88DRAFT_544855 [Papiliotrema laurentii]
MNSHSENSDPCPDSPTLPSKSVYESAGSSSDDEEPRSAQPGSWHSQTPQLRPRSLSMGDLSGRYDPSTHISQLDEELQILQGSRPGFLGTPSPLSSGSSASQIAPPVLTWSGQASTQIKEHPLQRDQEAKGDPEDSRGRRNDPIRRSASSEALPGVIPAGSGQSSGVHRYSSSEMQPSKSSLIVLSASETLMPPGTPTASSTTPGFRPLYHSDNANDPNQPLSRWSSDGESSVAPRRPRVRPWHSWHNLRRLFKSGMEKRPPKHS